MKMLGDVIREPWVTRSTALLVVLLSLGLNSDIKTWTTWEGFKNFLFFFCFFFFVTVKKYKNKIKIVYHNCLDNFRRDGSRWDQILFDLLQPLPFHVVALCLLLSMFLHETHKGALVSFAMIVDVWMLAIYFAYDYRYMNRHIQNHNDEQHIRAVGLNFLWIIGIAGILTPIALELLLASSFKWESPGFAVFAGVYIAVDPLFCCHTVWYETYVSRANEGSQEGVVDNLFSCISFLSPLLNMLIALFFLLFPIFLWPGLPSSKSKRGDALEADKFSMLECFGLWLCYYLFFVILRFVFEKINFCLPYGRGGFVQLPTDSETAVTSDGRTTVGALPPVNTKVEKEENSQTAIKNFGENGQQSVDTAIKNFGKIKLIIKLTGLLVFRFCSAYLRVDSPTEGSDGQETVAAYVEASMFFDVLEPFLEDIVSKEIVVDEACDRVLHGLPLTL